METADVRRRIRQTIEHAKRASAERRARADEAAAAYETFLSVVAVPVFRLFAQAIRAEGHRFAVETPAGSVRLAPERSTSDLIELALDSGVDPPLVVARVTRGRGSRVVTEERPVKEGSRVGDLTEEDVLAFLLEAILPFVER